MWAAPTTSDRDRKQLLRTLIEEVILDVQREQDQATVTIRWKGGAITELAVPLLRHQPTIRTDEDTLTLLGRLAAHYDDATIAGILNRQGRRSATGQRFTAQIVSSLRNHWKIPRYQPPTQPPDGELLPISKAADQLGVAASTLHRWLQAGFIAGEQDTPARPGGSASTTSSAPCSSRTHPPATCRSSTRCAPFGVSRQTVLQRVKRGELQALHVRNGRRKGLRILAPQAESTLFDTTLSSGKAV